MVQRLKIGDFNNAGYFTLPNASCTLWASTVSNNFNKLEFNLLILYKCSLPNIEIKFLPKISFYFTCLTVTTK